MQRQAINGGIKKEKGGGRQWLGCGGCRVLGRRAAGLSKPERQQVLHMRHLIGKAPPRPPRLLRKLREPERDCAEPLPPTCKPTCRPHDITASVCCTRCRRAPAADRPSLALGAVHEGYDARESLRVSLATRQPSGVAPLWEHVKYRICGLAPKRARVRWARTACRSQEREA
jgi:hypothetical protein